MIPSLQQGKEPSSSQQAFCLRAGFRVWWYRDSKQNEDAVFPWQVLWDKK